MEVLAGDLALGLDPALLSERAGIVPDPWQARVLRSVAPRVLLNCSRQSGKSTIAAILAMHTALYEPGGLVLVLSPTQRQSGELFRKALNIYRNVGKPVPPRAESALTLELETGSRIVSLPGKENTVRSYSAVQLLIIDEAAKVSDDLYRSVRPMLAVSGGRLIGLSTPFGKAGWFYEEWTGGEGWERVEVPAQECPRISPEFLAQERRANPERWYRQEYLCSFEDLEGALFSLEDIEAAMDPREPPAPFGLEI